MFFERGANLESRAAHTHPKNTQVPPPPPGVYDTYLSNNYNHCFQVCLSKYATVTKCAPLSQTDMTKWKLTHKMNMKFKYRKSSFTSPQISSPSPVKLRVHRSRMFHSSTGGSDLFMILGFSTLYASSLWKTDTIVFAKLIRSPSQISPPSSVL